MPVTFVSPNIVHVFFRDSFHIIRQSARDSTQIISAITCAADSCDRVFLLSSEGHLCHITLKAQLTDLPHNFFTSSSLPPDNDFFKVKSSFGQAFSATSIPPSSVQENCDCQFVVCGSDSISQISFHAGRVTHDNPWKSPTDCISFIVAVSEGPLRNALVPATSIAPAIIAVSVIGAVRIIPGGNINSAFEQSNWTDGSSDILNMHQTPIFCHTDLDDNFVVIIGCFSSVVVIHRDENSQLHFHRQIITDSSTRLLPSSYITRKRTQSFLQVEDKSKARLITVQYNPSNYRVSVKIDETNPLQKTDVAKDSHESSFRNLLRGIEDVGERQSAADVENTIIQRLISSYNAALLFVMEWKRKGNSKKTLDRMAQHCRLSIDPAATANSPLFNLPSPISGKRCFLTVSFRNATEIALAEGWTLHIRVSKKPFAKPSSANTGVKTFSRKSGIPVSSKEMGVLREMHAPLKDVSPEEEVTISFPLLLDSHAPFSVTVSLCFQHPSAVSMMRRDGINIEVRIREDVTLDVMDLSHVRSSPTAHDCSHEWLADAQVMRLFDADNVRQRRVHSLMHRFEVPFSQRDVMTALRLVESENYFESIIEAQFMVSVSSVSAVTDGEVTTVTLQGVPHVLPFVRSAILRRLVDRFSNDCAGADGGEEKSSYFPDFQVHGVGNIQRWQRGLIDGTDACMQSFRKAESAMVDTLRLYEDIELSDDMKYSRIGEERAILVDAITSARKVHDEWRRKIEHMWSPQGVKYTKKDVQKE